MKLMSHCLWYFTLTVGAYFISFAFIVGSLTACIFLSFKGFNLDYGFSVALTSIITALVIAHALLFISSLLLLYGLCLGKPWTLLQFILCSSIMSMTEIVTIVIIVQKRDNLPDECMKMIAAKAFIIFALLFSAAEIYSLYVEWHEEPEDETNQI